MKFMLLEIIIKLIRMQKINKLTSWAHIANWLRVFAGSLLVLSYVSKISRVLPIEFSICGLPPANTMEDQECRKTL